MKILITIPNPLGDAILASGVIKLWVERYPYAEITLAGSPLAMPLLVGYPQIVKTIPLVKKSLNRHWWELWRETIGTRWDEVLDLRGSLISHLLWTKKRYRHHPSSEAVHRVIQIQQSLGLPASPEPSVCLKPEVIEQIELNDTLPESYLVIAPVSHWPPKNWPLSSFRELIRRLVEEGGLFPGFPVVLTGSERERELIAPLLKELTQEKVNVIDRIGLALPQTAWMLKNAKLFIGNDSGLMHVSAAMKTPTVGLFGPTSEHHYAPWGVKTVVVRTPESYEMLRDTLGDSEENQESRMKNLTVDHVLQSILAFWSGLFY